MKLYRVRFYVPHSPEAKTAFVVAAGPFSMRREFRRRHPEASGFLSVQPMQGEVIHA